MPGVEQEDGVVRVGPNFMTGHPGVFAGGDTASVRNAIRKVGDHYEIDYDYCKGRGLCVAECPSGAILMLPEMT